MEAIDLVRINDREFEALCCEVLGAELGVDVKQGRPGPDGGIDGLFVIGKDGRGVMQAKHYFRSGVSALLSRLRREEVAKAEDLRPARYVLMTSCVLGPSDRTKICEMFHGLIRPNDDIYDGQDICRRLKLPEYGWIKRQHYNLWLTDIDALEQYCGDGAYSKSAAFLEDIKEDLKTAVKTWAYTGARNKLAHDNVIIITGQAGCGKTTLAKQLVEDLVFVDGYSLVMTDYDLSVFERQMELHPDRKTVYLLDDFLGINILAAFSENRDSRIVNFIRRIKRSNVGKLIMTSRTYIVNDALRHSEKLVDAKISEYGYELSDNRITRTDRAMMVYSHLWHGDVSEIYKNRIYENENYFKIIDHRNFNPRVVSYCFNAAKSHLIDESEASVLSHVLGLLDNPQQVWRDCFDRLNELERQVVIMVFLVVSSLSCAEETRLQSAISRLQSNERFSRYRTSPINNMIQDLCGSLLSRKLEIVRGEKIVSYALFNPSIGDYIIATYGENSALLADAVLAFENPKVAIDMYFKEVWHKDSARYVESCKVAFTIISDTLEKNVSKYSPDFTLGLVCEQVNLRYREKSCSKGLAIACWTAGVWLSPSASPSIVVEYLNWLLIGKAVDVVDDRLDRCFLGRMLEGIEDCHKLLKLKQLYDHVAEDVPNALYEKLKVSGKEWAYEIASELIYDGDETEDHIYEQVYDQMAETFTDYEIDEDFVTVDDCIKWCDFSRYVPKADSDGSDWEDERSARKVAREIEDQYIRGIFRRG